MAWFRASVRSRTCSASTTECWNAAYGSLPRVTPDSTRSISAPLMRCSLWFSRRSAASSACSSAMSWGTATGNGNAGEGLVDVHAIELFSIGVETHHPLLTQKRADLIKTAVVFELQTPQETVATDGQQQIPQALLQPLEQALQVRQHRPRGHGGEDDAVFHGAVETQAQVRMHLLDGP